MDLAYKNAFLEFFQAQILLRSGASLYVAQFYLISALTWYNYSLGDSRHTWCFIISEQIRNSHKPGCTVFELPKNCDRWDFKSTCIHCSCSFGAKTALPC